ncbi:MAG: hypothetical protein HC939_14245 [Pleurocapsa sp. SU_5_0]|nr:hypothetical protein [Pleurocapsa sp. SU_5_0]
MLNGKLNGNSAPQQQLDYQKMAKEPKNTQIEDDLTAAQKAMPLASPKGLANASFAIADVKQKVEVLNQSHQNLHQMVDLLKDMQEKSGSSIFTNPAQLPMGEITLLDSEVTLEPMDSYDYDLEGKLIKTSESVPSLLLMNQFIGDITSLSDKISQQSLIVTDSFRKLAEFAQQLSECKKP